MFLLEKLKNFQVVLASKSPRRQQLLKDMGIAFEVLSREVDESYPADLPLNKVAVYLANKKADAIKHQLNPNQILITSDTIVLLKDKLLEKAADKEEAVKMLNQLSGKKHEVITGVCIISNTKQIDFQERTVVYFKTLKAEEIAYYITHYQPFDKAGAYGIQEWIGYIGVEKIEGSYFNVMGLPTAKLYQKLSEFIND